MTSSLLIFGDICPDNDYRKLFDERPEGAFAPEVAAAIRKAGLAIANLECPATAERRPIVKCGPNLRSEPRDISVLKDCGFGLLSLANNHILDFGEQGVRDTLAFCREAEIATVGAGENVQAARRWFASDVAGRRIALLSFAEHEFNLATEVSPGANPFDAYTSFDEVREAKRQGAEYVVVLYHGGIEHYKYPSPLLRKKCRKFVESGADLVLCQHSHCIGTLETYVGGTILYGQGNSLFGFRKGDDAWNEGLVVAVDLDTREISFRLLEATGDGVRFATREATARRLEKLHEDSQILTDDTRLRAEWRRFCDGLAALDLPLLYGRGRVFNKLNRLMHNRLIRLLYSRKALRVTMNLLRCDAHREVLQTLLEETQDN